jgi:hypothetical protein
MSYLDISVQTGGPEGVIWDQVVSDGDMFVHASVCSTVAGDQKNNSPISHVVDTPVSAMETCGIVPAAVSDSTPVTETVTFVIAEIDPMLALA